jgi:hypothetical protein
MYATADEQPRYIVLVFYHLIRSYRYVAHLVNATLQKLT